MDDHLGQITAAKQRIELSAENPKPVHSAPHRSRFHVCKSEKNDIAKMLELAVIELAKFNWVPPFVLMRKKACSSSVLTTEKAN